jgi:hypothetical protein
VSWVTTIFLDGEPQQHGPARNVTATADRAWQRFDEIVSRMPSSNPWQRSDDKGPAFVPDLVDLSDLLAVPIELGLSTQSGLPAKALDVWVAAELRRAGFQADEVWPRASEPRVLPIEVAELIAALPIDLAQQVSDRLVSGRIRGGVASRDAK